MSGIMQMAHATARAKAEGAAAFRAGFLILSNPYTEANLNTAWNAGFAEAQEAAAKAAQQG